MPSRSSAVVVALCVVTGVIALGALTFVPTHPAAARRPVVKGPQSGTRLVTGKSISPFASSQVGVGNYPMHAALDPSGRFALISDIGARAYLSVIDVQTGALVSRLKFIDPGKGLYYGIAFGPVGPDGSTPVYVSHGSRDQIGVMSLAANGGLTDTGRVIVYPPSSGGGPRNPAGLAVSSSGKYLFSVDNTGLPSETMKGMFHIFDTATGQQISSLLVPGYPYAVVTVGNQVYLTSEQRARVVDIDVSDPSTPKIAQWLHTGSDPVSLTLNRDRTRLFVANASSDTVTVLNIPYNTIERTILVRPPSARAFAGTTPLGTALSPDERTLYVALADMNAVAVIDLATGKVQGYIPTGWYPTDVVVSPNGSSLLVSCARGVLPRVPNNVNSAAAAIDIPRAPRYITHILEGTVSRVDLPTALRILPQLTIQTLANNSLSPRSRLSFTARTALTNPGIDHVIYIIKENRTYDQVLGDMPKGNGDRSLCLYGRDVTPNQHALADRFVLLDNFYCCAEVSGDGWNWSTAGMASHYVSRNVPYSYAHSRPYDFEGANNSVAVERIGLPDVGKAPGGYIWDACDKAGVSLRNYGFFTSFDGTLPRTPAIKAPNGSGQEVANVNVLAPDTDPDFRQFDLHYPDSNAMNRYGISYPSTAMRSFGEYNATSRFAEFQREYSAYVKSGDAPAMTLIRLPRDHTSGTAPGTWSPRAMVADNDYAVGQIVETVSHGPFWRSTAIIIVEDDAQDGYDHVDAHRSTMYLISPFVQKNLVDSRFYNTDSILHTIECLLGLDPMSQYDAIAPTLNVFTGRPANDAPYTAILPGRAIIGEINGVRAYRAADSKRMLNPLQEESHADEELNAILWRDAKGPNAPLPEKHYGGPAAYSRSVKDHDD